MSREKKKPVAVSLATATCARLEFYMSDGSIPGNLLVGNQGGREIYPDLDAVIAQISYCFGT